MKNKLIVAIALLAVLEFPCFGQKQLSTHTQMQKPSLLQKLSLLEVAKNGNLDDETKNAIEESIKNEIKANKGNFGYINKKGKNGKTALIKASEAGLLDIVTAILDALSSNPEWVLEAINTKETVEKGYVAKSALMEAARQGHTKIVQTMLNALGDNKVAAITLENNDGLTALNEAAFYGSFEVVREFVKAFDNDRAGLLNLIKVHNRHKNCEEDTALKWAASNGHLEVVQELLTAIGDDKSKPEFTNIICVALGCAVNGSPPMWLHEEPHDQEWFARYEERYIKIVNELLNVLGDNKKAILNAINVKDKVGGMTQLMWAAYEGYVGVIKVIFEALGDDKDIVLKAKNSKGRTLLALAGIGLKDAANELEKLESQNNLKEINLEQRKTFLKKRVQRCMDTMRMLEKIK